MGLTSHAQRTNVRKRPFARTQRGRPSQGKSGSALGGIGRRGRSGRGLQQEMVLKFDVEAGSRAGNRSVVFVVRVIEDAVGLRGKAAEFDVTFPGSRSGRAGVRLAGVGGSVKRVEQVAVFLDGVSFRGVVAVDVGIEKIPLGKHFLVVERNPFFPMIHFLVVEKNGFVLGAVVGPGEFGAEDTAGAQARGEVAATVLFVAGVGAAEAGQFDVIAVGGRTWAEQRRGHLGAAGNRAGAAGARGGGPV